LFPLVDPSSQPDAKNTHESKGAKSLSFQYVVKLFWPSENSWVNSRQTSHKKARNISQHVCRIGHHFTSSIVGRACSELGISINSAGRICDLQNANADSALEAVYATSKRQAGLCPEQEVQVEQDLISQEQLDHEARNALTDLFPKIPERDLVEIISRAFKKVMSRLPTYMKFAHRTTGSEESW
jgi:hypothetical protein